MLFITLILLSALALESLGTVISVLGLSSLFMGSKIVIALAVALDVAKVISVSFLYKHWQKVNIVMKSYMTIAAVILMIITSAGAFGFLSGEFQKAMTDTSSQSIVLQSLEEEKGRLQKRKEEIDKQIAQLPDNIVRGRSQLMKQFAPEVDRINNRLVEIDKQLPQLKIESIKKNVEIGPIMYVAQAFDTTPEKAVKWVIFIIIFVFDPLAISLLLAANFLIEQNKNKLPALPFITTKPVEKPTEEPVEEKQVVAVEEKPVEENKYITKVKKIKRKLSKNKDVEKLPEVPAEKVEPAVVIVPEPPVRSSLENINVKNSDVEFDTEKRRDLGSLRTLYSDKDSA